LILVGIIYYLFYFIYLIRSENNTEQSNRYSVSRTARLVHKHSQLP